MGSPLASMQKIVISRGGFGAHVRFKNTNNTDRWA